MPFIISNRFSIGQIYPLEVLVGFSLLQVLVAGHSSLPTFRTEGSRRSIDNTGTHQGASLCYREVLSVVKSHGAGCRVSRNPRMYEAEIGLWGFEMLDASPEPKS